MTSEDLELDPSVVLERLVTNRPVEGLQGPDVASRPSTMDDGQVPAQSPRRSPTYPSLKYGPTAGYGTCEMKDCESAARTTCADCGGHYCLSHVDHDNHLDG